MANKRVYSQSFAQRDDFRIAILCALPLESDAVEKIFDEVYETKSLLWQKSNGDTNCYTTGKIGAHYVVLAYMPGIGKVNAAITASSIRATFRNITLALIVGICGGAPTAPDGQAIYCGDVVVSTKILQTDFGRELTDQFIMKEPDEGNLGPAGKEVLSFLSKLRGSLTSAKLREETRKNAQKLLIDSDIHVPHTEEDVLFKSDYIHKHHITTIDQSCNVCYADSLATCSEASALTCLQLGCSTINVIRNRSREVMTGPDIFFGAISSTDTVKKNGVSRDHFVHKYDVLAFEMEGAGSWNILPTVVVKAVCDYADSHKHKNWQPYAAITAAAACRAILDEWQTPSTRTEPDLILAASMRGGTRASAQQYLDALDFVQLDSRSASIAPAYPMTCDWVFKTSQFLSWLSEASTEWHRRILCIKGKPGVGKSTLLKHIQLSCQNFLPNCTMAAFYFHARGEELQKSRLGMLRAILHQLFTNDSYLLQRFMKAFPRRGGIDIEHRVWSCEELQNFLLLSVERGWLSQAVIFIDALDECTELEARELVAFCENLALNAVVRRSLIYICLSTRHYPSLGLFSALQLNMDTEQEHRAAIQRYIEQRLHIHDESIVAEVFKRASNVFLWAKLVTSTLNTAFDKGVDSGEIRAQLNRIPVELNSIYETVFQSQDSIAQAKTVLLLQLILYAACQLSPRALYLLMKAKTNPDKLHSWDNCGMTDQALVLHIFTVSRGLVEIVQSNDGEIVQFIHETVRGFLLEYCEKREKTDTSFSSLNCNAAIVRCCLASISTSDHPRTFWNMRKFPHIEYALRYVLSHLGLLLDMEQLDVILKQYCDHAAKYLWFYLRGRQKQLSGSPILRTLLMSEHCQHETILVAILANAELLLPVDQRPPNDHYTHALLAAAEQGLMGCLRILLRAGANPYILAGNDEYTLEVIMRLLSLSDPKQHDRVEDSQFVLEIDKRTSDIVVCGLDELNEISSPKTLSQQRVKVSWLSAPALEFLFDAFLDSTLSFRPDLLDLLLIMAGRALSPSCLWKALKAGADVNSKISTESVFFYIIRAKSSSDSNQAKASQLKMIKMLLDHLADPNSCDASGFPAIFYAIIIRHLPLTDLLLQRGANPNCVVHGVSLLHLAAFVGFVDSFEKLLSVGLNIDVVDRSGRTPLYVAMGRSSEADARDIFPVWIPRYSTEFVRRHQPFNASRFKSLSMLQKRLIQSTIKLMEQGAYIHVQDSAINQDIFDPRRADWNKNIEAVKKLLEIKAHAVATQPADVVNKYFTLISAEELVSLLPGFNENVYSGEPHDYSALKRSLNELLTRSGNFDHEAINRVIWMIEKTVYTPSIYKYDQIVAACYQRKPHQRSNAYQFDTGFGISGRSGSNGAERSHTGPEHVYNGAGRSHTGPE